MRFYQKWKIWLSLFFMINLWNDTGSHHILSSQCIHIGCLSQNRNTKYSFCYTMLQYVVSQDPGQGKVIADYITTITPIAFIFTRYCLFFIIRGCTCEQISWYWFKANIPLNKNALSMLKIFQTYKWILINSLHITWECYCTL